MIEDQKTETKDYLKHWAPFSCWLNRHSSKLILLLLFFCLFWSKKIKTGPNKNHFKLPCSNFHRWKPQMTLPSFPPLCRQHNAKVQPPVNLGFSTIETNQISWPPKSIKNPYNQIHKISHPQPASPPNQLQIPHVKTLKKKKKN